MRKKGSQNVVMGSPNEVRGPKKKVMGSWDEVVGLVWGKGVPAGDNRAVLG